MWTKQFWQSVAERSVSTFVQAFLGAMAVYGAGVGFQDVDWINVLSIAGVSFLLAVVKNVGVAVSTDGNPSVGTVESVSSEMGASEDT